jgi:hypothetical protein
MRQWALLALLAAVLPVATVPRGVVSWRPLFPAARRAEQPTRVLGVLRCRGGDEQGEAAWAQRLAEWEGEDSSTPAMMRDDDESGHGGDASEPACEGLRDSPSSHRMVDSSSRAAHAAAGAHPDAEGLPRAGDARTDGAGPPAVQDAGLERVRRASVIQELLSMGADIRRAGALQSTCAYLPAQRC